MNRLGLIKTACTALAALMLAACTQDEGMDDGGTSLPEGKYPLEISSVQVVETPQTRVSENPTDGESSQWDWNGNEKIGVQLYSDGDYATYTLNTDKTLSPDKVLYWRTASATDVHAAWYPVTDGTIDLSKQNNGLAYAMKGTGSGNYKDGVSLTFTHSLAKVRVAFSDESTADLANATVSVWSYPSCTSTRGAVTGTGTQEYIPMKKVTYSNKTYYEANLVSGALSTDAFQIKTAGGKTVKCSTSSAVALTGGQLHIITLKINNKPINLNDGKDINITDNGTYTVSGTGTKSININGSPTVILNGVSITTNKPINITGGTPTIKIKKGTSNTLTSSEGAGISLKGQNTNVNIIGNGIKDDAGSLTVKGGLTEGSPSSGIGLSVADTECGDITIDNITLTVTGGDSPRGTSGGAAIGTYSYNGNQSCGNIKITNSKITAYPGTGGAAIGFGMVWGVQYIFKMGEITIENSEIVATLKNYSYQGAHEPAIIGSGAASEGKYTFGNISIRTSDASTTPQAYFQNCTGAKVLVGVSDSDFSHEVNSFKIYWNGKEQSGYIRKP